MTYREKLAKVIDLESDKLLQAAQLTQLVPSEREILEVLCRCAKILGAEASALGPPDEADEEKLLDLAERGRL